MSDNINQISIKSKRDWRLNAFIWGVSLLLITIPLIQQFIKPNTTVYQWGIVGLAVAILLWFLYGTSYSIKGEHFFYRSGFIRGKIAIEEIKKLTLNKTMWVGLKPATALHGVIIRYGFTSEIYISPENNETFAKLLCRLNPSIEVQREGDTP